MFNFFRNNEKPPVDENKEKILALEKFEQTSGLEIEKLSNNDLALLVINSLGVHVGTIEDIQWKDVEGTDFENGIITKGREREVSLDKFLSQKGVIPTHTVVFGDIMISPNYDEILNKAHQTQNDVVSENPFDSIGNIFKKIKDTMDSSTADTYMFQNTKTGVHYSFPKRFAEGFFHLAKHLESVYYNHFLAEKFSEKGLTVPDSSYKPISKERHSVSKYLLDKQK